MKSKEKMGEKRTDKPVRYTITHRRHASLVEAGGQNKRDNERRKNGKEG